MTQPSAKFLISETMVSMGDMVDDVLKTSKTNLKGQSAITRRRGAGRIQIVSFSEEMNERSMNCENSYARGCIAILKSNAFA